MFDLLKQRRDTFGSVFFRGEHPGRAEDYGFLRSRGIDVSPGKAPGAVWSLDLCHDSWGPATLIAVRDSIVPPEEIVRMAAGLEADEKEELLGAGCGLSLKVQSTRANTLRDRKNLLRYLRAVMDDDGIAACDHTSQLFWPRGRLDDELSHDADLDISALYCLHAVYSDDGQGDDPIPHWIHTHGLGELGAFDFDVVRPTQHGVTEAMRAMAYSIIEGKVKPGETFDLAHPEGSVRLVPAAEFMRDASKEDAALREARDHTENRVVLCEPAKRRLLSLGGNRVRPSNALSGDLDGMVFAFTESATELMGDRARKTLDVLRRAHSQLERFELPTLVKLGYEVDGDPEEGREHLWFQAHSFSGNRVDATLLNEPFNIERMKAGMRGPHDLDRLTEWQIGTPLGNITPGDQTALRQIMQDPDRFGQLLDMFKQSGEE